MVAVRQKDVVSNRRFLLQPINISQMFVDSNARRVFILTILVT